MSESDTGPIKTPAQLLWVSFFALVAPIFVIIGLVYFVTAGDKPAAGAVDQELAIAERIQRVGTVALADPATLAADAAAAPAADAAAVAVAAAPVLVAAAAAPAAPATDVGAMVYRQSCTACHVAGVAGAPKSGDKAAWAPRLALGLDGLTASVLRGKGVMPPRGGSTASDADIRASVQYMLDALK